MSIGVQLRLDADPHTKFGFISGNFNVLHPGHVRLLQFASELCDKLVVGLLPDGATAVTVSYDVRAESLRALAVVDHVVALDRDPLSFISALQPEVVVKGYEFADADNPEQSIVEGYGGRLVFGSGETQFSSIELIEREFQAGFQLNVRAPVEFLRRHDITLPSLKSDVAKLENVRVLIIGDLIIDDYLTCSPLGMSQEDPTIVVMPIATNRYVGGAGVVSAHARALGADVRLLSVVGDDQTAEFAGDWLKSEGVEATLLTDNTRPTTVKERYRANGKTLLRVNRLRQHPISLSIVKSVVRKVECMLNDIDLILFSDFNYGCLPQGLVSAIVARAKENGVMMAADSQASSQMADISRFRHMELITPTEREARLAMRDDQIGLAALAQRLLDTSATNNTIITLAAEGLLVCAKNAVTGEQTVDRLPAFNSTPLDVAGAGDSLFTTVSLARCAGVDIWRSVYLGSVAAACQVSRVGNAPLSHTDLLAGIETLSSQSPEIKTTSGAEDARISAGGWAGHQAAPLN